MSLAAVLDKLLSSLPEVARAIAEPLTKVDKITLVSTDGAAGSGASKLTGDVAKVAAQVPALLESLSGVSLADLLRALPRVGAGLGQTAVADSPEPPKQPLPPPLPRRDNGAPGSSTRPTGA